MKPPKADFEPEDAIQLQLKIIFRRLSIIEGVLNPGPPILPAPETPKTKTLH